jgi:hypothetical protein
MRIHTIIFALAVVLACGCATEHHIIGHGDVGQFILQRAIGYGGSPTTTNGLPAITSRWSYYEGKDGGVVILMSRSDYSSGETFLSQAFAGQQQFGPKDGEDGLRIFECRLTPNGGGVQLTRHKTDSQVIVLPPLKRVSQ